MRTKSSRPAKKPRKVTADSLERAALHYLERYATSAANLRRILMRRVLRSAEAHGTDPADGKVLVDALVTRYRKAGLLDDAAYARMRAESLHRRIVEVRQYPSVARVNGWEGKVVLKVKIRQDGHLDSVSVVKSSGHESLDNAAMEAVRLACPLHMKHEISSPMVVVQVPINYSLNR